MYIYLKKRFKKNRKNEKKLKNKIKIIAKATRKESVGTFVKYYTINLSYYNIT